MPLIKKRKILVIRNDKLGDFMLTWPALSLLKKQYPDSTVTVLVPSYTKPVAEVCPWIDNIITDDIHKGTITDALQLAKLFKPLAFDASISLYSEMRTTLALWIAHIPRRFGPATKLALLFLNRRLKQKRSLSLKSEYEYNTDLVRHYIAANGDSAVTVQPPPYLHFDPQEISALKQSYRSEQAVEPGTKLVFLHAGSGGSAINLDLQQFAELAALIARAHKVHFVLTAGPGEYDTASKLATLMNGIHHSIYHSTGGLVNFSKFISICDMFISGSTGPLHIAGALNVSTAAFYPARRSATPLRWQTINDESRRIFFSPEKYTGDNDMQTIDIAMCADRINQHLSRQITQPVK